jgi:hypothetical protein
MTRIAVAGVMVLAVLAGCGGGGDRMTSAAETTETPTSPDARGADAAPASERLRPSRCPPGLPACRTTEGRIAYVERVDPDGDGDAHFVVVDPQGITVRGLTFVDVRKGLRPHPLPGIGDRISAAGPVQTGSYGQSQIHAIELYVAGE